MPLRKRLVLWAIIIVGVGISVFGAMWAGGDIGLHYYSRS